MYLDLKYPSSFGGIGQDIRPNDKQFPRKCETNEIHDCRTRHLISIYHVFVLFRIEYIIIRLWYRFVGCRVENETVGGEGEAIPFD